MARHPVNSNADMFRLFVKFLYMTVRIRVSNSVRVWVRARVKARIYEVSIKCRRVCNT